MPSAVWLWRAQKMRFVGCAALSANFIPQGTFQSMNQQLSQSATFPSSPQST
jgi:hypothetical protein